MFSHRSSLKQHADQLVQPGKGILAADDDPSAFSERFRAIGIENTAEQRRIYRQILFTTEQIGRYLSGALMHEEAFDQSTDSSQGFPLFLTESGLLPGIRLDRVNRVLLSLFLSSPPLEHRSTGFPLVDNAKQ